jgi:hypothetical protein
MDPEKALQIVDGGLSALIGTRAQHVELQQALAVIIEYVHKGMVVDQKFNMPQQDELTSSDIPNADTEQEHPEE